jgi:hypothetical protein
VLKKSTNKDFLARHKTIPGVGPNVRNKPWQNRHLKLFTCFVLFTMASFSFWANPKKSVACDFQPFGFPGFQIEKQSKNFRFYLSKKFKL